MTDPALFDYVDPDPFGEETPKRTADAVEEMGSANERELLRRQRAYRRYKLGRATAEDIDTVQLDLAKFCRVFESTHAANPHDTALLNGRREVFMRMFDFSELDLAQLYRKYVGR